MRATTNQLLVRLDRVLQSIVDEMLGPAEDRVIGASGKPCASFVADSERHVRGVLQIERERRFGARAVLGEQAAVDANDLERSLFQVVRFLRVECQDLPGDLALGDYERGNGLGPQPPHGLQAMAAIGCPKPAFGRRYGNDGVKKAVRLGDDVSQPLVVGVGQVALKRRRFDARDG